MTDYPKFLEIKVGKLAEAKELLTEFFGTGDGEFDCFHMGWELRKANEHNLLDVLSHGPVIALYCSDKTFDRIKNYYQHLGIVA